MTWELQDTWSLTPDNPNASAMQAGLAGRIQAGGVHQAERAVLAGPSAKILTFN